MEQVPWVMDKVEIKVMVVVKAAVVVKVAVVDPT
jgi:hypothetical protein